MAVEIKPLTSIRGIAALLVVVYHFHQTAAMPFAALGHFIHRGYFWVDLFFVLSGFVMALTYADMFGARYDWRAHRDFLVKRIARVYPLYIAVTLAVSFYSLAVYGGYGDVHRPAVHLDDPLLAHVTNILMIQAWGFGTSIGGASAWSISTEWAAYLLFPFLVYCSLFAGRIMAGLLGLAAVVLLVYVATHPEFNSQNRNGQMDVWFGQDALVVMRCLGGFCIGLLAFRATRVSGLMHVLQKDVVCAGLFVALVGLMASTLADLWLYPLLPLLVLSLYSVRGWAARFFSLWPLYRLGILSYSIYLVHVQFHVLFDQLNLWLPRIIPEPYAVWVSAGVTYSAVLLAALAGYYLIERPSRAALRRWTNKGRSANLV